MADGNAVPDDEIAELIRDIMFAKIIGSKVIFHPMKSKYP